MPMSRTLNRELLKSLVSEKGGSVTVSYEADVGHSTLEKLMGGTYPANPRKKMRSKLSTYLGVSEDVLFPPVAAAIKAS